LLKRSLVLPPMWWANARSREAYGRSDPASFSATHDQGCRMRRVSIARKLCVLRHDQLLSAWSLTKSLCPTSPCFPLASNVVTVTHFSVRVTFSALPPGSLGPQHRRSTAFKLHRARVRRNRGRLPSSRCIESAPSALPHPHFYWIRASDTALGLIKSLGALHDSPVLLAALRYRLFDCSSKLTVWTTVPEAFPQAQSRACACPWSC
jgi:hypothetical protein